MTDLRCCSRLLALAFALATTAACLPRGEPPAGRQIIADRKTGLGLVLPPTGDGVLRVLVLRPNGDNTKKSLTTVSVAPGGGPPTELLLADGLDINEDLGCIFRVGPCSALDVNGQVWVYGPAGLLRIDPLTAAQTVFKDGIPGRSTSGQRISVQVSPTQTSIFEADGRVTVVEACGLSKYFIGDDFYYLTSAKDLMRIPPSGVAERVATAVDDYRGWPTPDGTLLVLERFVASSTGAMNCTIDPLMDRTVLSSSIRDPATGQETVLPFDAFDFGALFSPDWRWLSHIGSPSGTFGGGSVTLLEWRTGTTALFSIPGSVYGISWRLGPVEAWTSNRAGAEATTWVMRPGADLVTVPGVALGSSFNLEGDQSPFSEDGARWFSVTPSEDGMTKMLQAGPADDPNGPRIDLMPVGTALQKEWRLDDGRLLLAVAPKNMDRTDVFAVDVTTGVRTSMGERGRVAAVGKTRMLGMFRYEEGRGDLTSVDLGTGAQTILAPEFTVTAFAEPRGADIVAPGAPVVYQYQARSNSPYDGIWVVDGP